MKKNFCHRINNLYVIIHLKIISYKNSVSSTPFAKKSPGLVKKCACINFILRQELQRLSLSITNIVCTYVLHTHQGQIFQILQILMYLKDPHFFKAWDSRIPIMSIIHLKSESPGDNFFGFSAKFLAETAETAKFGRERSLIGCCNQVVTKPNQRMCCVHDLVYL